MSYSKWESGDVTPLFNKPRTKQASIEEGG